MRFLYQVLGFTALFCVNGVLAIIPQITDQIEIAVVQEKGTAYLNCTMIIDEDFKDKASWYRSRDKKQLSIGSSINEPVREGPHNTKKYAVRFLQGRPNYAPKINGDRLLVTYQLIIFFVDRLDDGEFRCVIEIPTYAREKWPTAYGRVAVKLRPEIFPNLTSTIINEGAPLKLDCSAQGSPNPLVSWTRANGKPLSLPGSPQRFYNKTLYLPAVNRFDRGVYRCYAVNNVDSSAEYDVMIEVNYAPHVRPARVHASYGQARDANYDVTLECIVNGYPDPDLYWYRGVYDPITNNRPLFDDNRYELEKTRSYGAAGMNVTDVFSVLIIRNIRGGDYGNYSCRAENPYGSHFTVVNLFYQTICQGSVCPMLGKGTIIQY